MKLFISALFLMFAVVAQAGNAPAYCVDFSPEECARITAVVESKIRPDYCVAGFARADSGLNLSAEQLRICYLQSHEPPTPEEEQAFKTIQAKQNQVVEDARAMVKESWGKYIGLIEWIETGFKCDVVDQLSANVAIQQIQSTMQTELNQAGLLGDKSLSIKDVTAEAVRSGKAAAERGACTQMSPAARGQLRAAVANLMPR